ncbi:MAG: DUF2828 family protein [Spirochaetia bacterium]|nr:DUF2828 family protein [Spirochaetia bacterium]MBR5016699.1 DUF2828 family protein [Spirochaetia bacterium]
MNAVQEISRLLNVTRTENGDLAYKSTGSFCLDYFSLCGGLRHNTSDLEKLFVKAYSENPILAIKILFYMRNIRGGLGERNSFRVLLRNLAVSHPDVVRQIMYAIPVYGRWDDILALLGTQAEPDAVAMIKDQLAKDKAILEKGDKGGDSVSLLGKWLPSVNAKGGTAHAIKLMKALGMNAAEYRKLCSALRREIRIIENNLRTKDYTFDYSKQPSQAMLKYKKAFLRNDAERYKDFLNKVIRQAANPELVPENERVNLNTKTLYPYQIVAPIMDGKTDILPLEAAWKAIDRSVYNSRTIVVRDGSGSMYWRSGSDAPIKIATSLALLFAEQLDGAYKNSFITFSSRPELIQIPDACDTLKKKLEFVGNFGDCSNTDIGKVYQVILKAAMRGNIPQEEMIERILIISDMEFDCCSNRESSFDYYKRKFAEHGYELPEIVFWNVEARNVHMPVTVNERGVKLVSGASPAIFADVISDTLKVTTPYDLMLKILAPYAEFDQVIA